MRDLMQTQGLAVLETTEHFKLFQTLAREANFHFRSEMAESVGKIKFGEDGQKAFLMTKECFQETYFDEFMELISDSDNMVRIKAFEAVSQLVPQGILE